MLPSGNTDLSQTQGWIKSLFILQSHILKNHTDIFSFLTVIPIIVKHNKYHSPHQMQLGSSQQCWLPRVCPVWSVEDVMSLVTNGNWIVAYVMKFVLRHAQPLLLWSRTVPLRDNDCTGQFPGVPHVCEGVGMKQRGAQLAPVFFLGGGLYELQLGHDWPIFAPVRQLKQPLPLLISKTWWGGAARWVKLKHASNIRQHVRT